MWIALWFSVDQPHAAGLAGAQELAGKHDLHRIDRPGLPDRAAGTAEARKDAEIDLGEADARLVVVDGDPVLAGERQLQPAAKAEAMDAGNDRHLQRLDPVEQRMRPIERRLEHAGIGHLLELGDVGPRNEAGLLARKQHHALEFAVAGKPLEGGDDAHQLRQSFAAEGVHRRVRHIDGEPADALEIEVKAPGAA